MENKSHSRSLFWPILLIGIGVIWLLSNLGYIQPVNLSYLLRFWPLILVVLGIDMIFSHQYPWVGALVGILAVAGVVAFLIASPSLGIETGTQTKTETFTEPIGQATSAEYYFETSSEPVKISSLNSSDMLIDAEITHRGIMNFDVSGTTTKKVQLSETFDNSNWLTWDFSFDELLWDIQLAPDLPSEIILSGGSGSIDMDLSNIELTSLQSDFGSGSSDLVFPKSSDFYDVEIDSGSGSVSVEFLEGAKADMAVNSGSGSIKVDIPDRTSVNLTLDNGSGSVNVSVPENCALRVEVMDEGSGSLNLPDNLERSSDSGSFSSGAWQTDDFDQAANKILITITDQGSGSISIH